MIQAQDLLFFNWEWTLWELGSRKTLGSTKHSLESMPVQPFFFLKSPDGISELSSLEATEALQAQRWGKWLKVFYVDLETPNTSFWLLSIHHQWCLFYSSTQYNRQPKRNSPTPPCSLLEIRLWPIKDWNTRVHFLYDPLEWWQEGGWCRRTCTIHNDDVASREERWKEKHHVLSLPIAVPVHSRCKYLEEKQGLCDG